MASNLLQHPDAVLATTTQLKQALSTGASELAIQQKSDEFASATSELHIALEGPQRKIFDLVHSQFDFLAVQCFLTFRIFDQLSTDADVALANIAATIGVDENRTGRLLRHLATLDVVCEDVDTESFSLTKSEFHRSMALAVSGICKHPHSTKAEEAPWVEAWGAPIYEWYKTQPSERVLRFAACHAGLSLLDKPNTLVLDWATSNLHAPTGMILDVGGEARTSRLLLHSSALDFAPSNTHQHFPNYTFDVQDHDPTTYQRTADNFAAPNIGFRELAFFQPQPTHERPVLALILRHVLHSWSDEQAVRILQALVPTMRANPEARILLHETVMPKPGQIHPGREQRLRRWDLAMLVVPNTRQRTEAEWRELVRTAGSLEVEEVLTTPSGPFGLIVVKHHASTKWAAGD